MNVFEPPVPDTSGSPTQQPDSSHLPAPHWDALADLARHLANAPIALISLVQGTQRRLLGQAGIPSAGTALPHTAWALATLTHADWFIVPDASASPSWQDDWWVVGPAGIRFHAGIVIRDAHQQVRGTLSIMDTRQRDLAPDTLAHLSTLSVSLGNLITTSEAAPPPHQTCAPYQAMVESQTDLICLSTPEGRLTFVNHAYAEHVGQASTALVGANLFEHLPASAHTAATSQLQAVAQHGLILSHEVCYESPDGQTHWLNWTRHPLPTTSSGSPHLVHSVGRDITERKLTERTLKDNQARLRSLYESTPAMMHSLDASGRLLTVSDTWLSKLGYSRSEVIGRDWTTLLTPASLERERQWRAHGHNPLGARSHMDYQMLRRDGQVMDVLLSATVERDDQDRPLRTLAILEDVTEKHQVQAALHANQERLALATQANGIGIWELDLLTQQLTWNDMMFHIFGESPDRFQGQPEDWLRAVHPDDVALCWQALNNAVTHGQPIDFDFRIVRPDGRVLDLNARATVFFDEHGQALRLLGTNHDVTERKRMERELAQKHELLRVTLHSIGDAVITTDAHGWVQWLNPVAERMTGWTSAEAQGQALREVFQLFDEDSGEPVSCPVQQCLGTEPSAPPCPHPQLQARHGTRYGIEHSTAPIQDAEGVVLGAVLVFHDVTEQRRMGQELSFRATHDPLTGLANRTEFESRLQRTLADAHARNHAHALMYIDLDQFKAVNDACGHAMGDVLLKQVSELLLSNLRSRDTLARLGGDEFGIILEHCAIDQAELIGQKICDQMEAYRFVHEGRRFRVGTSIGLVPLDERWADITAATQAADVACYGAKAAGRNRVEIWTAPDTPSTAAATPWAIQLEQALVTNSLHLHGQHIMPLSTPSTSLHCEVLLLLGGTDSPSVSADTFGAAAERHHLSQRLDWWTLQHALSGLSPHHAARPLTLSFKLSSASLLDATFSERVLELLSCTQLTSHQLRFEVSEAALLARPAECQAAMAGLHAKGIQFALDDFGANTSALGYLANLPLSHLKIDAQFFKHIERHPIQQATVRSFVDIARTLQLQTIAKGIDDEAGMAVLHQLGIDHAQGLAVHPPQAWPGVLP